MYNVEKGLIKHATSHDGVSITTLKKKCLACLIGLDFLVKNILIILWNNQITVNVSFI